MNDSYNNTQADRLRKARLDAGIETAADAVKRYGWAESTYNSHENGNRTFPLKRAKVYASAFKVDPYWLLDGSKKIERKTVTHEALLDDILKEGLELIEGGQLTKEKASTAMMKAYVVLSGRDTMPSDEEIKLVLETILVSLKDADT